MKRELFLFLILFAAAPVYADPVPPSPVTLPAGPPVPPQPAPPKTPTKLAADQVYVVRASVQCSVIDGTEGIVKITEMQGPVTIHAKFTDGVGYETRTLTDKYIYLVEPVGTGRTDLIITYPPSGKIRVCLDVTGTGPKPPDPPQPPDPPVSPLTKAFQAAYDGDNDADKAKSLAFLQAAYAGMAQQAPGKSFTTNTAAVAWMKSVVEAPGVGLTANQVVNLRKAIGVELAQTWGTANAPLTPVNAATELSKIATALQGVK